MHLCALQYPVSLCRHRYTSPLTDLRLRRILPSPAIRLGRPLQSTLNRFCRPDSLSPPPRNPRTQLSPLHSASLLSSRTPSHNVIDISLASAESTATTIQSASAHFKLATRPGLAYAGKREQRGSEKNASWNRQVGEEDQGDESG